MKKKLRKKLGFGTDGLTPEQQKVQDQYKKALKEQAAYLKSKYQNPIFLKRAANELKLSNQMQNSGLAQPYPEGYEKQWAQEKIENLDDYAFDLSSGLELFSKYPGMKGFLDTDLINDSESMVLQQEGPLANKFTVPIERIDKTLSMNPNISFSDNIVKSTGVHELAHVSNAARKGYNNPFNRLLGTVEGQNNTSFDVMGQQYNTNPYALGVIKKNVTPDPDNYFDMPTEVESGKRQVEYLLENAPAGVFAKPWKYGDEVDETHWDYIHNPQKYSSNPNDNKNQESDMMLKAIYGRNKFNEKNQLNVTDEEKKAKFKNFKELMKLAQQNSFVDPTIQTAAYGGAIKKYNNGGPVIPYSWNTGKQEAPTSKIKQGDTKKYLNNKSKKKIEGGYRLPTGEWVSEPVEVVGKKPTMFEQRIKSAGKNDSYKAKNLQKFLYDGVGMLPGLWGNDTILENLVLENLPLAGRAFSVDDLLSDSEELLKEGGENAVNDLSKAASIGNFFFDNPLVNFYETMRDLNEDNEAFDKLKSHQEYMKPKLNYKKNMHSNLPQMGFGGKLAPTLFDVGSNMLGNLTGAAITNMFKSFMEGEDEVRMGTQTSGVTMANGGMVPNIPVEVEGDEMYHLPNGEVGEFQGPSHENGGIPIELPEGTKVYSDRIEINGETMAKRKEKREKMIAKMEKLLGKNNSDKILKATLERQKEIAAKEEQQDMLVQEQVNQQQAQQEQMMQQQMMAGMMQDPAMMQQMGMMAYGGTIPKLNNGTPPKGIPVPNANTLGLDDWANMYGSVYNPTKNFPNIYYGQAGNDWYMYDKSRPNAGWKLSSNKSGNDWLNKNWIKDDKNVYAYHQPIPIPTPEEMEDKIAQESLGTTSIPRLKSIGLNETVQLNPNEKYLGKIDGFNVIGGMDSQLLADENKTSLNNNSPMLPTYPLMTGVDPISDMLQQTMMTGVPDPMAGKYPLEPEEKKKQNFFKKLFGDKTTKGDKTKSGTGGDTMTGGDLEFTRGDLMGMAGNLFGGIAPMATTLLNRMMTPEEKNHYREYGADALKAMQEAQGLGTINRDKQLADIKLGENAAKARNKNTARGANTLRALDTMSDMTTNQAQNQAYNMYAQQMMGLLGQKAQMENVQDQYRMTGEEKKAENILKNLDNFYTNLGGDLTNQAERMMLQGRNLNQAQYNKDFLNMAQYMSNYGLGVRMKNGKLEMYNVNTGKKASEKEVKAAQDAAKSENQTETNADAGEEQVVNPLFSGINPFMQYTLPEYNLEESMLTTLSPGRKKSKTKKGK